MTDITEFTAALHLAAKALQFYSAEHPRGVEALTNLDRAANAMLADRPRVTIVAAKGTLVVDGLPMEADALHTRAHVRNLAHELEARQFGGLILTQGVMYRELVELVRLFVMKPQQLRDAGGAEEILKRADVMHVRISHVRYEAVTEGEEVVWSKTARIAEQLSATQTQDGESLESMLNRFLATRSGGGGGEGTGTGGGTGSGTGGGTGDSDASGIDLDALSRMVSNAVSDSSAIELLRARLAEVGISREQLDEIVSVVGWDKLPTNEKIEKLLAGTRIFDFPREKLVIFMRDLLTERRHDDALRVLEAYARGIDTDNFAVRQNVADTFGQVAAFIETPGVSPQIDQLLTRVILNHFVKENDARMQSTVAEAVASLCTSLVATGRAEVALRVTSRLESAVSVADPKAAVRQAYESLGRAFSEPKRAARIIAAIFAAEPEVLNKAMVPLATQLGGALVPALMEALANEEDRNRRGRLVRVLKGIGNPAHPLLLDALQSQTWYVVRNTLNILGEFGERDHAAAIGKKLQHGDARVRRAAARALGKIGGVESESLLVDAVGDRDAETQREVLLCLASMKAQSAVPALGELAKSRSLASEARELVISTLAQIGSASAVPALGEIVKPKGIFAREPLPIRLAAARALAQIGTAEAKQILRSAIAAESDRAAREAFTKITPHT